MWIADFACLNPRIVIEMDGPSHDYADETLRTEYLESQGYTVLRVDNDDIRDNILGVCALIEETVAQLRETS